MKLQKELTRRIDDFGGIEKLTLELRRYRTISSEKKWFDNMIIYFNSLYTRVFDIEATAREYRQASLDTITFLQRFNQSRNEDTIVFLIDLIRYKLERVRGVRNISQTTMD